MKVVFDIDNTLSNLRHRLHFIQPEEGEEADWWEKDWDGFFAACVDDTPIPVNVELCRELLGESVLRGHLNTVEFWTGRNEDVRSVTEQWLADHVGKDFTIRWPVHECVLKMRSKGDRRPDHVLKMGFIDWNDPPDIIFEDRATVVKAYRELGLTVFQVAEGDF
jgi:hypothetical protein